MALSSSKRRKLDHDSKHLSPDENISDNSNAESPSSQNPSGEVREAAISKQARMQSKRAPNNDSAIYDAGLHKSSLFKLQVDELLTEVQPNYEKKLSGVDDALRKLKGLIEGIEDRDALSVSSSLFRDQVFLVTDSLCRFPKPQNPYTSHTKSQFPSRILSRTRMQLIKWRTRDPPISMLLGAMYSRLWSNQILCYL